MHCTRKINADIIWVGADDRRLAMFEGVYSVPAGVSYNSYLIKDEKTALIDTVDKAVGKVFFENLEYALEGRTLDYVVVQHMEPDHSATLAELILRYPGAVIVCNNKIQVMIKQYFGEKLNAEIKLVGEGDKLELGLHTLSFVMAPMVHWPEVMVSYDSHDRILFSADAFGAFGALNGALFADEVDFEHDYMGEARRYYCNIVGKYGTQVQSLLTKAAKLDIAMICPLHGFVHRSDIGDFVDKYNKWSTYTPEEKGVTIAYASVYGNTENAAAILAGKLRERGVPCVMFDVSVTPASEIIASAFRYSHIVFASTTYNAGIFVSMEDLLRDLAAHNIQNRTVAFIENGSWAPVSGKLMRAIIEPLKNMRIIEEKVTLLSAVHDREALQLETLSEAIAADFKDEQSIASTAVGEVNALALFKLSYGLFVLSAKEGDKDNACIINTACQVTDTPKRVSITVNKANLTHDMIMHTGVFNLSVLSEETSFDTIKRFGFSSGRDGEKFGADEPRAANGVKYLTEAVNAMISGKVISTVDCATHTIFIAEVSEALKLSDVTSVTYDYYFKHIKPKPQAAPVKRKGFVCKICGYVYEGDTLPADFICPLCKHGAEDFEPLP